jgi:tetratricopeptide (TPR) repeat protein
MRRAGLKTIRRVVVGESSFAFLNPERKASVFLLKVGCRLLLCSFLVCCLVVVLGNEGLAGPKESGQEQGAEEEAEVDHLSLAALLIKDGYYDRAEAVLAEVDPAEKGLDLPRYHTLRGLVHLHRRIYAEAKDDFLKAAQLGQEQPILFLYLAQAHYGLQEYQAALKALDRAGETAYSLPGAHIMKIQCTWHLDRKSKTFDALDEAERRFPSDPQFKQQRVLCLAEMGLFREAVEVGTRYLAKLESKADDYVLLGESLRRGKQPDNALVVLESAKLVYPEDTAVLVSLAHTYLDKGQPLTAGKILEEAGRRDPKYISEAAELYRRAGDLNRALYLNGEIRDQKAKTRQRLGILLQLERFEEAAALESRVSRLGLLKEEKIRYAVAYVCFKTGRFKQARTHLKRITKPDLFHAATELLKAMEACEQSDWQCI